MLNYRVISIGTLSSHPLWHEPPGLRTPHATTTLVRDKDRAVLVDPGLPPQIIGPRLTERSGMKPEAITDVVLTNFRPAHHAGLAAFEHADWWISAAEREAVGVQLVGRFEIEEDEEIRELLRREIALLKRCKPMPEAEVGGIRGLDPFPMPGYTPGGCGLLINQPGSTVLIAGDAVATADHYEQGMVLTGAMDIELATESFKEAIEIADLLIPGHDNLIPIAARRIF